MSTTLLRMLIKARWESGSANANALVGFFGVAGLGRVQRYLSIFES
jgi:hypothetical protein